MNRLSIIALSAFCIVACGQNTNLKPPEKDLVKLENNWMHAMMKRDEITLNELVAAEFSLSGMKYIDSVAVSRAMWMNNIMQDLKIDSVHFIKTKVTTVDNIGIVRVYFFWSGTYDEKPFADSTSFVDTWIQRNGGWQVVSRMMTE